MEDWYAEYKDAEKSKWQPTKLPAKEEKKFQDWIEATEWFKQLARRVPTEDLRNEFYGPRSDYDYRAAYKEGVAPEQYSYDEGQYHWPSSTPSGAMLKSPTHPTAWMEYFMRNTGVDPNALGLETPEAGHTLTNQMQSVIDANKNMRFGIVPLTNWRN